MKNLLQLQDSNEIRRIELVWETAKLRDLSQLELKFKPPGLPGCPVPPPE